MQVDESMRKHSGGGNTTEGEVKRGSADAASISVYLFVFFFSSFSRFHVLQFYNIVDMKSRPDVGSLVVS